MASAAVKPEFAIVHVIGPMTVRTAAAQPGLRCQRSSVTGIAAYLEMCAVQPEGRLTVVIELPLQPVDGVVAQGTVFREAVRVRVFVTVAFSAIHRRVAENMRIVTRVALFVGVRSQEWETCQAMIEEDQVRPRILGMAVQAGCSLCALMGVVFLVAVQAAGFRFGFEYRLDVTPFACDEFVRTVEPVLRVGVMVEVNCRPCFRSMAGIAGAPEMTFMIVVLEMAGDAGNVHFVVERILAVAVAAGKFRVPTLQCELRVTGMIELGVLPPCRRVTFAALLPAAAVVSVVLGVAVEAVLRWRRERLVCVAARTISFPVLTDQREAGRVMIEVNVGPGDGGMAVRTLGTHGVAVNVVCLVAGKTLGRRIAVLAASLVAFRAICFGMLAEQREVGEVVVEAAFVELHDIGVPPFMVGMAACTARIASRG